MEDMQSIFMAEANEIMADLERGLLKLEADPANKEAIASVFRSMHTLKGSAGMFGLVAVHQLTHQLETVYEAIRNGQRDLSTEILRVTFASLDHLNKLLADRTGENSSLKEAQSTLLGEIETLLGPDAIAHTSASEVEGERPLCLYYVHFAPRENVLANGTNTLYLVDDLLALGSGTSLPYFHSLPLFDRIAPSVNHTCFEILVQTARPEAEIREVFLFVEAESELEIKVLPIVPVAFTAELRERLWKGHLATGPRGSEALMAVLAPKTEQRMEKPIQPSTVQPAQNTGPSIRVASERLDELMNLSLHSGTTDSGELTAISENVEKITRRLRDNAFSMSLVPIESLVVRFQRLVRDLSKELNKDVVFIAEGADTEIDKSIIEKLTDPLLHLLRNSMDHGIEAPEVRARNGKPKQGTVKLKAYYAGAKVAIEIQDDGAGIDLVKVKEKAIANGLLDPQAEPTEKEILDLIFLAGFSTAEKVTGVSGRGVGMDVVRRNISDIRGEVDVSTVEGKGTTFTIKLPLTLSIIDGLLVRIGATDFLLPLLAVNKCYEVETHLLRDADNGWLTLEGARTPFLLLRDNFEIDEAEPELSQVINVAHKGKHVGLAVDRIIGEYQAVLKPLGEQYKKQDEFSGATILGDGSVALVVDTDRLIDRLVEN
jgi:two-component system, chemotaxis family, sensor kinase CheA